MLTFAESVITRCFRRRVFVRRSFQCITRCQVLCFFDTGALGGVLLLAELQCDCKQLLVSRTLFAGQSVLVLDLNIV